MRGVRGNLHIVVDLNLGEESNIFRLQPEGDIPTAITATALNPLPLLNPRHHDINQLPQKQLHVLPTQLCLGSHRISPRRNPPSRNTSLGLERLHPHIGNRLDRHPGHMQPPGILLRRLLHIAVDRNALDLGDIIKVDGLAQQPEHIPAAGPAQRPVLVVGRAVIPAAQTGGLGRGPEPGRHMHVAQGEDVGGECGLPGLLGSG